MTAPSESSRPIPVQEVFNYAIQGLTPERAQKIEVSLDNAVEVFRARIKDPEVPLDPLDELPEELFEPDPRTQVSTIARLRGAVEVSEKRGLFEKIGGLGVLYEASAVAKSESKPNTEKAPRVTPSKKKAPIKKNKEKIPHEETSQKLKRVRKRKPSLSETGFSPPTGYSLATALIEEFDISAWAFRKAIKGIEGWKLAGKHGILIPTGIGREIAQRMQEEKRTLESKGLIRKTAYIEAAKRRAARESSVARRPEKVDSGRWRSKRSLAIEHGLTVVVMGNILEGVPTLSIGQQGKTVRYDVIAADAAVEKYKAVPVVDERTNMHADTEGMFWGHTVITLKRLGISGLTFNKFIDAVPEIPVRTFSGRVHNAYNIAVAAERHAEYSNPQPYPNRVTRADLAGQFPDIPQNTIADLLRTSKNILDIRMSGSEYMYEPEQATKIIKQYHRINS